MNILILNIHIRVKYNTALIIWKNIENILMFWNFLSVLFVDIQFLHYVKFSIQIYQNMKIS